MKKIEIYQEIIFEISKFLRDRIKDQKIFIHQQDKKFVIKLTQRIDRFKLEEIKSELKLKYPDTTFDFIVNS